MPVGEKQAPLVHEKPGAEVFRSERGPGSLGREHEGAVLLAPGLPVVAQRHPKGPTLGVGPAVAALDEADAPAVVADDALAGGPFALEGLEALAGELEIVSHLQRFRRLRLAQAAVQLLLATLGLGDLPLQAPALGGAALPLLLDALQELPLLLVGGGHRLPKPLHVLAEPSRLPLAVDEGQGPETQHHRDGNAEEQARACGRLLHYGTEEAGGVGQAVGRPLGPSPGQGAQAAAPWLPPRSESAASGPRCRARARRRCAAPPRVTLSPRSSVPCPDPASSRITSPSRSRSRAWAFATPGTTTWASGSEPRVAGKAVTWSVSPRRGPERWTRVMFAFDSAKPAPPGGAL